MVKYLIMILIALKILWFWFGIFKNSIQLNSSLLELFGGKIIDLYLTCSLENKVNKMNQISSSLDFELEKFEIRKFQIAVLLKD